MFWRWFVGAYSVAVLSGFATANWIFPMAPLPIVVGFFYLPFALPFTVVGALLGWALQWALSQWLRPGPLRLGMLALLVSLLGGAGLWTVTRYGGHVPAAVCSALAGAMLAESDAAWRRWWLVVGGAVSLSWMAVVIPYYM